MGVGESGQLDLFYGGGGGLGGLGRFELFLVKLGIFLLRARKKDEVKKYWIILWLYIQLLPDRIRILCGIVYIMYIERKK